MLNKNWLDTDVKQTLRTKLVLTNHRQAVHWYTPGYTDKISQDPRLKPVQTWVIFLWWIPGWKCKHGASVCWKPCQNQRKFTEFTRIWNEGTFFLKEYGRIEAKLVYFFDIKCRFMYKTLGMDIVQCEEFVLPHKIFQNFAVLG